MEQFLPPEMMPVLEKLKNPLAHVKEQKVKEYRGFRFFPVFDGETIRYAMEDWDMPERTVFLVSFPKTGTNWTSEIVTQILSMKDEKFTQIYKALPLLFTLEAGTKEKYQLINRLPIERLFMATHAGEELFDYEKVKKKKGKVIYVMRNPKDQTVSFYHFSKQLTTSDELRDVIGRDWNQYFANCLAGKHPQAMREGENYPDHISGWLKHKDDKDFLVIVYENMKKDLKKEVARIAEFLEVQLTDEEVTSIADACTFTSMKKRIENEKDRMLQRNMGIMRKGEVGGWKEYFTVAQSEQMDKQIEEKLGHTGIKFTYEQ